MTTPPRPPGAARRALRHFKATDLGAVARLATEATHSVIDITEGVHHSVLGTMGLQGPRAGRTAGITGLVYRGIRTVTGLVGHGLGAALSSLAPVLQRLETSGPDTPERLQLLAVLNGVVGDRLAAQHNPLALPMTLQWAAETGADAAAETGNRTWQPGQPLAGASGHVLLTIHGLCMNDHQWRHQGHDHGAHLAQALGCTRLNLRYNTGLHVTDNGEALSHLLQRWLEAWPVPVQRLSIVAHSMGGLVARSAVAAAGRLGHTWPAVLRDLVCLGTPHHGAPLERAGHWVDTWLAATPFSQPFVRLGQLRSAGILDLRHGHVLPDGDPVTHPHTRQPRALGRHADTRTPLPLPEGVRCFAVAATLARQNGLLAERLTGDGLVPLNSALGKHTDARHRLHFPPSHQLVVHATGHLGLLSHPAVAQQLVAWLSAEGG